jgi:hypothetical protein
LTVVGCQFFLVYGSLFGFQTTPNQKFSHITFFTDNRQPATGNHKKQKSRSFSRAASVFLIQNLFQFHIRDDVLNLLG